MASSTPPLRASLRYPHPPPVPTADTAVFTADQMISTERGAASSFTLTSSRHPKHYLAFPFAQREEVRCGGPTGGSRGGTSWSATRPAHTVSDARHSVQVLTILPDTSSSAAPRLQTPPARPPTSSAARSRPVSKGSQGTVRSAGSAPGTTSWRFLTPQSLGNPLPRSTSSGGSSSGARFFLTQAGRLGVYGDTTTQLMPVTEGAWIATEVGAWGDTNANGAAFSASHDMSANDRRTSSRGMPEQPASALGKPSVASAEHDRLRIVRKHGSMTAHGPCHACGHRLPSHTEHALTLREQQREEWVLETLRAYLPPGMEEEDAAAEAAAFALESDEDNAEENVYSNHNTSGGTEDAVASGLSGRSHRPSLMPGRPTSGRTVSSVGAPSSQRLSPAFVESLPTLSSRQSISAAGLRARASSAHSARHSSPASRRVTCPGVPVLPTDRAKEDQRTDHAGYRLREALVLPNSNAAAEERARRQQENSRPASGHRHRAASEAVAKDKSRGGSAGRFAVRMESLLEELAEDLGYVTGSHDHQRLLDIGLALREQRIQQDFPTRHPLAAAHQSKFDPSLRNTAAGAAGGADSGRRRKPKRAFGLSKYASAQQTTAVSAAAPPADPQAQLHATVKGKELHGKDLPWKAGSSGISGCAASRMSVPGQRQAAAATAAPGLVALLHEHDEAVSQVKALEEAAERSLQDVLDRYEYA